MITDYATLKTAIANWLARADLTSAIPEFIQLAESRINRSLYVRERMSEASGTSADGLIPVPDDLDRVITLRVAYGSTMREIHPVMAGQDKAESGTPDGYVAVGSNFRLVGTDDSDYTLTYFARIPPLSDANSQNWLLAKEPGLYLYGALLEAAPYLRNDDRAVLWAQQYKAVIDDLKMTDEKARFGNSPAALVDFNAP
jgi:hypothetical protein